MALNPVFKESSFNKEANFVGMIYADGAPVIAEEDMESEDIQANILKEFVSNFVSSGVVGTIPNLSIVGTDVRFSEEFTLLVDGNVVYIPVDAEIDLVSVVNVNRIDTMFLELMVREVNGATVLNKYGCEQLPSITNHIINSGIGLETSRRKQLYYRFRVEQGVTDLSTVKARGNNASNTTTNFVATTDGHYIASDIALNTVDDLCYAYPIATINRNTNVLTNLISSAEVEADMKDSSIVKAKLEPSIQDLLTSIEVPDFATIALDETTQFVKVTDSFSGIADLKFGGDTLFNAMINGNFENGTVGWVAGNSALSLTDRVVSITGDGTSAYPSMSQTVGKRSSVWENGYIKCRARVTNSLAVKLVFNVFGESSSVALATKAIDSPVQNVWYDMDQLLASVGGTANENLKVQVYTQYSTPASASGKVTEVDGNIGVFVILTKGTPYVNMTVIELSNKIGAYWEGFKGATNTIIGNRGKNLFDVDYFVAKCPLNFTKVLEDGFECLKVTSPSGSGTVIPYRFKPNTQYTFKYTGKGFDPTYTRLVAHYTDGSTPLNLYGGVGSFGTSTLTSAVGKSISHMSFAYSTAGGVAYYKLSDFQIEEGVVATIHEPFDGSRVIVSAIRHKLPSLIEDTLDLKRGRWTHNKRIKEYTMKGADIEFAYVNTANNVIYQTKELLDDVSIAGIDNNVVVGGLEQVTFSNNDNVADRGKFMTVSSTKKLYFIFALGTSLKDAQKFVTDKKLMFKALTPLAIPESQFPKYNIDVVGSLSSNIDDTEFYVDSYDVLSDVAIEYPVNISASNESFKRLIGGLSENVVKFGEVNIPSSMSVVLDKTTQIVKVTDLYACGGIADMIFKGDTLFNAAINGNFASGWINWSQENSATTVANNTATSVANGAYLAPDIYQAKKGTVGQKVFFKARVRVTNSVATSIRLLVTSATMEDTAIQMSPVSGQWYDLFGLSTLGATAFEAMIRHTYVDAATANGKTMEVQNVFYIPIIAPYENMTAKEINSKIGVAYFEGAKCATNAVVGNRGKNLFDHKKPTFIQQIGDYVTEFGLRTYTNASNLVGIGYNLKLKPNTKYTYSYDFAVGGNATQSYGYLFNGSSTTYDAGTGTIGTFTKTFTTNPTGLVTLGFSRVGGGNDLLGWVDIKNIQLEEGMVITEREPFDGSQVLISAIRHKLPNLVEDSLAFVDGRWLYYPKTNERTLVASDITNVLTSGYVNFDLVGVDRTKLIGIKGQHSTATADDGKLFINGFRPCPVIFEDTVAMIGTYIDTAGFSAGIYLVVPNGTYPTLGDAQTALAGSKIVYERDVPLVIEEKDFGAYNVTIDGSLSSNYESSEFYVSDYDVLADTTITYETNTSGAIDSLKKSVNVLRKNIGAGAWIKATTAPMMLYVRPDGNDANDGSADTPSKAIKTIQSAINRLPKYLKHGVYIRVATGTYDEDVVVEGFIGRGALNIEGDTVSTSTSRSVKSMVFIGCSVGMSIKGINVMTTVANSIAILVDSCTFIRFWYMNVIASGTSLIGFYFASGSKADVRYSTISNKLNALLAQNSDITSNTNIGTGNTYGLLATGGSRISKLGTQPSGTENADSGGEISASLETLTINSGFVSDYVGTITLKKDSTGFVNINLNMAKATDIVAGGVTLTTLPAGWLPKFGVTTLINLNTSGGVSIANSFATIAVTTGGGVVVYPVTSTVLTNARYIQNAQIGYNTV